METPNVFYVDKSHFIPKLEAYGPALILLAPRRFGKSIFLDMLANYYDKNIDNKQFQKLFGNLHIGKHPTKLRGKFHVLKLDFSTGLDTSSIEAFNQSLQFKLSAAVSDFRQTYQPFPEIELPPRELRNYGVVSFEQLTIAAKRSRKPVRRTTVLILN